MWWQRFTNRTDAYSAQSIKDGKLQYFPRYFPLTPELFDAHLSGLLTLGLPAVNGEGTSKWCCFDSDSEDGAIERIHKVLADHGWHALREGARPGRAGHLWMFLQEPINASVLRLFGQRVIETARVLPRAVEFFPKQDQAEYDEENRRVRVCSVVRLPLGIHRKPEANGARGWFVGVPQDVQAQVQWLEKQPLNPVAPIIEAAPMLKKFTAVAQSATISTNTDMVELLDALYFISPDDYEVWYRVGMALKAASVDFSIWDRWSSKSTKYSHRECTRKWEQFPANNRIGIGTIFYLAKKNGYTDGRRSPFATALTGVQGN